MVGHEDDGRFVEGAQLTDELEEVLGLVTVEISGGFVGEEDSRTIGEGSCEGDALFFAS